MTASSTASIYQGLESCLNPVARQLLDRYVSVKVYETQFFRTVFHPIHEYVFGLSFLTILNIYKDYFKDHKRWRTIAQEKISREWRSVTKMMMMRYLRHPRTMMTLTTMMIMRMKMLALPKLTRCLLDNLTICHSWQKGGVVLDMRVAILRGRVSIGDFC